MAVTSRRYLNFFLASFAWLLMMFFQLGFVASLPFPWKALPLVLFWSVYLVQRDKILVGSFYLIGYGLVLDILHVGDAPLEIITSSVAILAAYSLSHKWFSHRTFLGTSATMLGSLLILSLTQLFTTAISTVVYTVSISTWTDLLKLFMWRFLMMTILLFVLLTFGRLIRDLIKKFVYIPTA